MKKRKKKNAITLLALVITIVIMLLLAGVAIQMTMGENGLIAKSVQAQKEQAKAELYDTAKLSYMSLNAKALENGQPSPQAELALSTIEFTNKYNVVGDDITDKKGTVIDTKANVLNIIQGTVAGGFTPGTTSGITTPAESWPKTVAGVTIPEEDKEKMILKLRILSEKEEIEYGNHGTWFNKITKIEYGNGVTEEITDLYSGRKMEYNRGEYIVKIDGILQLGIGVKHASINSNNFEIEILQWGKIDESEFANPIGITNVSAIYEPEPDKVGITYYNAKFTEIPEWIFSKKVTGEYMSEFHNCKNIRSIPENLFKECRNAKFFNFTFDGCTGITSIPENLFKYNTEAESFVNTFNGCTGIINIPESIFKHNTKVQQFHYTFSRCTGITSIPENLFKYNIENNFFTNTFDGCTGIINIPEKIIEVVKRAKENGGIVDEVFQGCTSASNYNSLPAYMK